MTKSTTITVRGHKVSNRSQRRFLVVAVRPEAVETDHGTYVAFADVRKRTDSIETARTTQRRYGRAWGAFMVIVDSETGEEV